jgi:hypothetical protein
MNTKIRIQGDINTHKPRKMVINASSIINGGGCIKVASPKTLQKES